MIGEKLRAEMNQQIKLEMESSYLYLSMAAYFHSLNLEGMAHWMRCQAHEETIHGMKFYDHIIERGGRVELLDMRQLRTSWPAPLEAWKNAWEHEKGVSARINLLMKIAREEHEYASEPLLAWFTDEQIEEESNTERVVSQLDMIEDNKAGIFMIDRELAARIFPPGSPFDPAAYKTAE